jgi:hypothetical protein
MRWAVISLDVVVSSVSVGWFQVVDYQFIPGFCFATLSGGCIDGFVNWQQYSIL